ncbi:uncharacterized protein K452DRAFT_301699 [Aplosporella prunicola CBS 121167]|uniref:Uncharacterized protein n=1 Tax=Aplosporella prunicola CBS 121167 TaxID=1176127 RepID=A0A6A6B1N3_9PEZI|nr:uncharacterized protein K452DRAFT_301699 [Aplosporella prunicola CBS 121167]KAF2137726.1 hypothetical protein K452DRAFT_301699 [Aplosporella prunicola CBS 121167]
MSEFDVAGNVFGVISLGIQVSAGLFNFIQVARGAPRDLETAHNDILALCAILDESSLLQTDPIEEIEIDKKEAEEIIQRLMAKWIED